MKVINEFNEFNEVRELSTNLYEFNELRVRMQK